VPAAAASFTLAPLLSFSGRLYVVLTVMFVLPLSAFLPLSVRFSVMFPVMPATAAFFSVHLTPPI
jgi:hypothetical protein